MNHVMFGQPHCPQCDKRINRLWGSCRNCGAPLRRKLYHTEAIPDVPEHSSKSGATLLAQKIAQFWAQRGRSFVSTVEPISTRPEGTGRNNGRVFTIKSNAVNGMPPRAR